MSRAKFAASLGAYPHNVRNAWSFINHERRFVLMPAYAHHEIDEGQLIFSTDWRVDVNGRKTASYMPTLRHLEYVIEEGYSLRTFKQYAVKGTEHMVPRISHSDEVWEERNLQILGANYYAVHATMGRRDGVNAVEPTDYMEGRALSVLQTHYERSPEARRKCLEHYKLCCLVCSFNFEESFGEVGRDFIHVHHLVPVSSRKTSYRIDPIRDLRPVCPNCHAMLHKKNPPISIEALKEIIEDNK